MTLTRRLATLSACVLGLAGLTSAAAHADPPTPAPGTEFSIGPTSARQVGTHGTVLFPVFEAALADVRAGDSPDFFAYCIERAVSARFDVDVEPASWNEFPGNNNFTNNPEVQRRVGWIVNNSYPTVPLEALQRVAGIEGLTAAQAIGGTQHAIWYLTDGLMANLDDNADALRTYLTGEANTGLPEEQVRPAVKLSFVDGGNTELGAPIGPVRVEANTGPIRLTTDGDHRFIDGDAQEIDATTLVSGDELFLDLPADAEAGSAQLTARVDAAHLNGSILKVPAARPQQTHAQTLILVKGETATSSDSLNVSWELPVLPTIATPIAPTAHVEVCESPDDTPGAWLETTPVEGLTYEYEEDSVYPGGVVEVIARPAEGYEIAPGEGWQIEEDGTARIDITVPAPDCPPAEELPPVEPPAEPTIEEEPPSVPPVQEAPPSEPLADPVPAPAPALAETGSASLGLAALAAALLLGGAAVILRIRAARVSNM